MLDTHGKRPFQGAFCLREIDAALKRRSSTVCAQEDKAKAKATDRSVRPTRFEPQTECWLGRVLRLADVHFVNA